jgi:hypothetical protein
VGGLSPTIFGEDSGRDGGILWRMALTFTERI